MMGYFMLLQEEDEYIFCVWWLSDEEHLLKMKCFCWVMHLVWWRPAGSWWWCCSCNDPACIWPLTFYHWFWEALCQNAWFTRRCVDLISSIHHIHFLALFSDWTTVVSVCVFACEAQRLQVNGCSLWASCCFQVNNYRLSAAAEPGAAAAGSWSLCRTMLNVFTTDCMDWSSADASVSSVCVTSTQ